MRRAVAWGITLLPAAVFDVWVLRSGRESLSSIYRTAPRWVTWTVTAVLLAHLNGLLPRSVDPFHRVAGVLTPTHRR